MYRKFLLLITTCLCILMGFTACQSRPADINPVHTPVPTVAPTQTPAPTETPTETPTEAPTETPTATTAPTETPAKTPTKAPTKSPTKAPTKKPTTGTSTPKPTTSNKTYNLPYILHVNRTQNVVTVYSADKQGNTVAPLKVMLCSTGRNNGTGRGTFYISEKYVWRALFGGVYGQYACRFNGHVLFHSVPYESKNKGSLKADEFNKLGTQASDGCVRLSVEDCKWIYDNCGVGTKVVVYASNDPEPLPKPAGIKIPLTATWDPTDPDVNNPWHSQIPVMPVTFSGIPAGTIELQRNQALPDFLKGITAVDSMGVNVTDKIKVKHTINIGKTGAYAVTYEVTNGATGVSSHQQVTYTVVDHTAPVVSGLPTRWLIPTANIEQMTKERFLRNATITDDGDVLSHDSVTVTINGEAYAPELLQLGQNKILFTITDLSGNTTQVEVTVTVRNAATPTPSPTPTPEQPTPEQPTETPEQIEG